MDAQLSVADAMGAIHATADLLDDAARRLPGADPGATHFGSAGPGVFGAVAQEAYRHWRAALHARAREAQAHATRVREFGDQMNVSTVGLADANESAGRTHRGLAGDTVTGAA
jgi:hypothetical protein